MHSYSPIPSPDPAYMHQRQLELAVAGHETEIAGLRLAVGKLDAERRLAAAALGEVAARSAGDIGSLAVRLSQLEKPAAPVNTKAVQVRCHVCLRSTKGCKAYCC